MTKTIATGYSVFAGAVRSARRSLLSPGLAPPASHNPFVLPRRARFAARHDAEPCTKETTDAVDFDTAHARGDAAPKVSTTRAIARIYPYARPADAPDRARHARRARRRSGLAADPAGAAVARRRSAQRRRRDGDLGPPSRSCSRSACSRRCMVGAAPLVRAHARARASRRACATTSTRSCRTCRSRFHDRWPSGQLLSRHEADLSLIRRWLSFGIVLLVVNLVTIVVGFVLPGEHQLDARRCCSWCARSRCGSTASCSRASYSHGGPAQPGPGRRPRHHGRGVGARHPGAQGVRARQARARERSRKQAETPARHRDREGATRSRASGCGCCWCPTSRFAVCLRRAASVLAAKGVLTVGELVAFFATADRAALAGGVDRLPAVDDLRRAHRHRPVLRGDRRARTRSPTREQPVDASRARRGGSSFDAVHFRYQDSPGARRRPARRRRPRRCGPARPWRWSA